MKNNPKAIEYPSNKEDIFTKLINFLKRLALFTKQNNQSLNYFLYGILTIILGIIVWVTNK